VSTTKDRSSDASGTASARSVDTKLAQMASLLE
jgi:hypothetical protein